MADITLAECGTQAWLVRGEQYIDDLLANTLPPDVSIEVIRCQSKSEVDGMGAAQGLDPEDLWLIHPGVVRRSKGMATPLGLTFPDWSASLDDKAQAALADAATALAQALAKHPGATLALVRHTTEADPPMAADLANLRLGLVEARLASLGADPASLRRETRPAETPDQANQVALAIRTPPD